VAEPSTLTENVRRWERWTDAAHRYVLPIASATGLGLAGAAVLGAPREVAAYAPWALAAIGTGALVTSLGYTRWRTHLGRLPGPTVRTPESRPRAPARSRPEPDVEREWRDLVHRSWHTAVAIPPANPTARMATGHPAGDELWSHWQPVEVGTFPVELVGPVPETAWVPTATGEASPFPDKEPGFIVVDGELLPMPGAVTAAALPASAVGPLPGAIASPPGRGPAMDSAGTRSLQSTPRVTELSWLTSLGPLDELTSEALHPIPPHLRISPDSGATEPATPLENSFEEFRSVPMCSSCSREVQDEADWRPCPECGEPVCLPCRSEAVVFYGHTWCATCAIGRAWNHPMVVGEPGRFAPTLETATAHLPSDGAGW